MQTSFTSRILLLSSDPGKTYAAQLLKTESQSIAELEQMTTTASSNLIPALASFFIPGLGQLLQGRILAALLYFIITGALWIFFLGWLGHIVACIDAARWRGR
jgi:hypothetical protein